MKIKYLRTYVVLAVAAVLLGSCHSDLALNNLDTSMEAKFGLSLPVGSLKLGVGDVLGISADTTAYLYVDSIDGRGVLTWKSSFNNHIVFHDVDLMKMVKGTPGQFDLGARLDTATYAATNPLTGEPLINPETGTNRWPLLSKASEFGIREIIIPEGVGKYNGHVRLDMPLEGINKDMLNERLDSARIRETIFAFIVNLEGFDDMKWSWIDSVYIDFGDRIVFKDGHTKQLLYQKGDPSVPDYGYPLIPKDMVDFVLTMVNKETKQTESSCVLYTDIYYTIPTGQVFHIPDPQTNPVLVKFRFDVNKFDFEAIWGWFTSEVKMDTTFDFGNTWSDMPIFQSAVLPFKDPVIEANLATQIAGAIELKVNKLYAIANDKEHVANFNGSQSLDTTLLEPHWLDPTDYSNFNDTARLHLAFDNKNGHIEEFFKDGMPTKIGYNFGFGFNPAVVPQIRIPNNTFVDFEAKATIPLIFNEGVRIAYTTKLESIDISQFNIDSLLSSVTSIDTLTTSDLGVIMTTESSIPLHLSIELRCFNEFGDTIMDPERGDTVPFVIFNDTTNNGKLVIMPPTYTENQGKYECHPTPHTNGAYLTKRQLDLFPKIKEIEYTIYVDDKGLDQSAYNAGVLISPDQYLQFSIALTAQVSAILNFTQNNNTK